MNETDAPMSQSRFEPLIAAYGVRPERWPDGERNAALALLAVSEIARALKREQEAVDGWLSASAPALSTGLIQRLNTIPEKHGTALLARHLRLRAMWVPVFGWAAAAVVGLWVGARSPDTDSAPNSSEVDDRAFIQDENVRLAISGSTLDEVGVP
jgi:hypothetical protein